MENVASESRKGISSGVTILLTEYEGRSLWLIFSTSTFPLPVAGLLETTQSTEAASVVSPIPGPHQTSGTATQLEDSDNDKGLVLLLLLMLLLLILLLLLLVLALVKDGVELAAVPPSTTAAAAAVEELGSLFFLLFCFFFLTFLVSQSADVLITAGTETCDDAVQPNPLKVADEKFFFL